MLEVEMSVNAWYFGSQPLPGSNLGPG